MNASFKALWITEGPEKKTNREVKERSVDDLSEGDTLIKVHYSSLNYKDALSAIEG